MKSTLVSAIFALLACGCGAVDDGNGRDGTRAGSGGAAGAGGGTAGDGFGNSTVVVPPVTGGVISKEGSCKPGHYLGQLSGMYESSAALGFTPGGVPISTDPMALDAALLNTLFPPANGVSPGFEFWLEATDDVAPCASDNEFCFDYKVEGGIAKGVANGLFPFELEINGDLNCAAGRFEGLVQNGWYEVAGIRFMYEGTIQASYDSVQAAFFDGTWEVSEPTDPNAGGTGTWYTAWVGDM